jgi:hypothetical protein
MKKRRSMGTLTARGGRRLRVGGREWVGCVSGWASVGLTRQAVGISAHRERRAASVGGRAPAARISSRCRRQSYRYSHCDKRPSISSTRTTVGARGA